MRIIENNSVKKISLICTKKKGLPWQHIKQKKISRKNGVERRSSIPTVHFSPFSPPRHHLTDALGSI